jgi:hypothetical protein
MAEELEAEAARADPNPLFGDWILSLALAKRQREGGAEVTSYQSAAFVLSRQGMEDRPQSKRLSDASCPRRMASRYGRKATLDLYSHLSDTMQRDAAAQIAAGSKSKRPVANR